MMQPTYKKKSLKEEQSNQIKKDVLNSKKKDILQNSENEEKKLKIKYYVVVFFWIEIIFLSFILNTNFVGDYNNFIEDPQVNNEVIVEEHKFETLLAKSKAVLSFTILVSIFTIAQVWFVHSYTKLLVKLSSIAICLFYLIRLILGILFLTDSGKQHIFDQKSNLDKIIEDRSDYCIEGQSSEIKLCRYVYSFNFFYGQEVFLQIAASALIVPYIILSLKFKEYKILQKERDLLKQADKNNVQIKTALQDMNETKDFLKQENQSHNTSIYQDNYILQQRIVSLENNDSKNINLKKYNQNMQIFSSE